MMTTPNILPFSVRRPLPLKCRLFHALVLLGFSTGTVRATNFLVSTLVDEPFNGGNLALETADGFGLSLREALGLAGQNLGAPMSGDPDGDTIAMGLIPIVGAPTITLVGGQLNITDDVVINGAFGALNTTIDAVGASRVFNVDTAGAPGVVDVGLRSFNLINGRVAGNGGGLLVTPGEMVSLSRCVVDQNQAGDGGGIYLERSKVTLTGGAVTNNTANAATGSGGGVFVGTDGVLAATDTTIGRNRANRAGGGVEDASGAGLGVTLTNVMLVNNNAGIAPALPAPGSGGGLHVTGAGEVRIEGGEVRGNQAALSGGGLWNGGGQMEVLAVLVQGNTAVGAAGTDGGGGIYNRSGVLSIKDSSIGDNKATGLAGSGGGILSAAGSVAIVGGTVGANVANRAGGGIEAIDGTLSLTGVTLGGPTPADGNVAGPPLTANPGNGGGIHISGNCATMIDGGTVANNVAAREGGGLWNATGVTMTLLNGAAVTGNSATGPASDDGGGGIFNNGGRLVLDGSMADITVTQNIASGAAGSGGGILNFAGGSVEATTVEISGNRANRAGGGLEEASGTGSVVLTDTRLNQNNAGVLPAVANPGSGGGLHVTGAGTVTLNGATVADNTAASEGGGLWNGTGTMTVDAGILSNNRASGAAADNGGGGIFNAGGSLKVMGSSVLAFNVANGTNGSGGGIFNDGGGVTIENSIIRDNTANRAGGGIEDRDGSGIEMRGSRLFRNTAGPAGMASPGNGGGAHMTGGGKLTFTATTINENEAANEGGGLWNSASSKITVIECTVRDNFAQAGGGGIYVEAGTGAIVLINATISGNVAMGDGGGILLDGGTATLLHATIVANTATGNGGGIANPSGTLDAANSIVALNGGASGADLAGVFNTVTHTLLFDAIGAGGITGGVDGNLVGVDPELLPLALNGGPTFTHLPLTLSPVVNAGDNGVAAGLMDDQRGVGYPRISGSIADMGAVEVTLLSYASWAAGAFAPGTPAADRLPKANPDQDVLCNAEEWLYGTDPQVPDGNPVVATHVGSDLIVTYPRRVGVPPGVETPEFSDDLAMWNLMPAFVLGVVADNPSTDLATLTVTYGGTELFARFVIDTSP